MYIVPSDIFVSYKLVPEVRMSYKFATPRVSQSRSSGDLVAMEVKRDPA